MHKKSLSTKMMKFALSFDRIRQSAVLWSLEDPVAYCVNNEDWDMLKKQT